VPQMTLINCRPPAQETRLPISSYPSVSWFTLGGSWGRVYSGA